MRAARLLHLMMLLQNRGRMTAPELAAVLEVSPRTVLRDVEALAEAGLPVLTHQGTGGGIELAFGFRARLTGLCKEEAEAAGLLLSADLAAFDALGLGPQVRRVQSKLLESLPEPVRSAAEQSASQFGLTIEADHDDPRIPAMAEAVRGQRIVRIDARGAPRTLHPLALQLGVQPTVLDGVSGAPVPVNEWRHVNISAHRFVMTEAYEAKRRGFARRRAETPLAPTGTEGR